MSALEKAFQLFDEYNQQDFHTTTWNNEVYPTEYFYAVQLYNWVKKLEPNASDHLLLASRAQHIGRWKTPRTNYPPGKAGYLNWRKDQAKFHAKTACDFMLQAGYGEHGIQAVQHIILKENLLHDSEVQVIENALCLVFLQFQFEDFIASHDDNTVIRILRKTWKKMTKAGQAAALHLEQGERAKSLIQAALHV